MGLICDCPVGAALNDVPIDDCPESFGQTQKAIIQRVYSTGTTKNTIANPLLLASWTPLLSSTTGTKVVQTPYISAPATEPGAAKKYGGGNETLGGVELIIGRDPSTFTGNILRSKQTTIKALKNIADCETVGVWLVNQNGQIGCIADDPENPTTYYPIPVHSLFIGDKSLGGFDNPDMNSIEWKMYANWSDNWVILTPTDFSALTDLATPESGS